MNKESKRKEINTQEKKLMDEFNKINFEDIKEKTIPILFGTIDFIFYNKKIHGITFKEITKETQGKILSIYEKMTAIVLEKYPQYHNKMEEKLSPIWNTFRKTAKNQWIESFGEENFNFWKKTYHGTCKKMKKIVETGKLELSSIEESYGEEINKKYTQAKDYTKTKLEELSNWYQEKRDEYENKK